MSDKTLLAQTHAAHRFIVELDGEAAGVFTECTLPVIEWELEQVKEGGLNTYTHQLPGRRKGAKLTLKNGVGTSRLVDWYLECMSEAFERCTIAITLLDSQLEPIQTWEAADAYPAKWSGPQFKSSDNSIAIQSLELACGEIDVY